MKDNVHVPGIGWWVLASIMIPVVQGWLMQAFPDSPYRWAPLAIGLLGAVAKWVEWILRRNGSTAPEVPSTSIDTGDAVPAAMTAPQQAPSASKVDEVAWWIFG